MAAEKGSEKHIDIFFLAVMDLGVPRKVRVEYEGAIYHVMNRGDRREDVFLVDEDRELFLQTLGPACARKQRCHGAGLPPVCRWAISARRPAP